jgi:ornithine cyclodeaminase/alanine dehydrogenase-like protein (mu-crystallin family)
VLGKKARRQLVEERTDFKSVGVAGQDAMATQLAMRNADKMGIGQQVNW